MRQEQQLEWNFRLKILSPSFYVPVCLVKISRVEFLSLRTSSSPSCPKFINKFIRLNISITSTLSKGCIPIYRTPPPNTEECVINPLPGFTRGVKFCVPLNIAQRKFPFHTCLIQCFITTPAESISRMRRQLDPWPNKSSKNHRIASTSNAFPAMKGEVTD